MIRQEKPKPLLIPQFSIRWMLMVTAACAVVFSIVGLAMHGGEGETDGSLWAAGVRQTAAGISLGIVSLAVLPLVYAAVFAGVWMFSAVTYQFRRRPTGRGRSPFMQTPAGGSTPTGDKKGNGEDTPAAPIILE